jgi:L-alanine-DL-glutamate epimerase-like enolase superfamily enzyme
MPQSRHPGSDRIGGKRFALSAKGLGSAVRIDNDPFTLAGEVASGVSPVDVGQHQAAGGVAELPVGRLAGGGQEEAGVEEVVDFGYGGDRPDALVASATAPITWCTALP